MADAEKVPVADGASKRPEKPDEAKYKADLAKAEKAHQVAQAAFVCHLYPLCIMHQR